MIPLGIKAETEPQLVDGHLPARPLNLDAGADVPLVDPVHLKVDEHVARAVVVLGDGAPDDGNVDVCRRQGRTNTDTGEGTARSYRQRGGDDCRRKGDQAHRSKRSTQRSPTLRRVGPVRGCGSVEDVRSSPPVKRQVVRASDWGFILSECQAFFLRSKLGLLQGQPCFVARDTVFQTGKSSSDLKGRARGISLAAAIDVHVDVPRATRQPVPPRRRQPVCWREPRSGLPRRLPHLGMSPRHPR